MSTVGVDAGLHPVPHTALYDQYEEWITLAPRGMPTLLRDVGMAHHW